MRPPTVYETMSAALAQQFGPKEHGFVGLGTGASGTPAGEMSEWLSSSALGGQLKTGH